MWGIAKAVPCPSTSQRKLIFGASLAKPIYRPAGIAPHFSLELRPLLWNDEKFEGKRIVLYRAQDLPRCKKPDLPTA